MALNLIKNKTNFILLRISIICMILLALLVLFSLNGFSFKSSSANKLFNIVSFSLILPIIAFIYLNLSRLTQNSHTKPANILMLILPVLLIFSPFPAELESKIIIFYMMVPALLLPGVWLWQRILMGIPVLMLTILLIISWPGIILGIMIAQGATVERYTVTAPDHKREIEVVSVNEGATGASSAVKLYKNYPLSIRRFEKNLWPGPWVEHISVRWINNKIIEIEGKRVNIEK